MLGGLRRGAIEVDTPLVRTGLGRGTHSSWRWEGTWLWGGRPFLLQIVSLPCLLGSYIITYQASQLLLHLPFHTADITPGQQTSGSWSSLWVRAPALMLASCGLGTLSSSIYLLPSCPLKCTGLLPCSCLRASVWSTLMVHSFRSLPACLPVLYIHTCLAISCLGFLQEHRKSAHCCVFSA